MRACLPILLALLCMPVAASHAATDSSPSFASASARLLAAHNEVRSQVDVPALQWDPALAAAAASYGPVLERLGGMRHSPRSSRPGQRENLWMGTRGAFSPEQMVGSWAAERRAFQPGRFPHVSRTGNWLDVSHYTQLVWRNTTSVGCAIHRAPRWDYLICRYSPPGNIDGQSVL